MAVEVDQAHHCSACRVYAELAEHRDATAGGWSVRRGTLNFAMVLAQRACSAYAPPAPRDDEAST